MTLRIYNLWRVLLVLILLIFCLIVACAGLAIRWQDQEIRWGLDEGARAAAVAVVELLDRSFVEALLLDPEAPQREWMSRSLNNLRKWDKFRRVRLLRAADDATLEEFFVYPGSTSENDPALPDELAFRSWRPGDVWLTPIDEVALDGEKRELLLRAYAPIMDGEDLVAILVLETDATYLQDERKRLLGDYLKLTGRILLVGAIFVIGVSMFITRRIGALAAASGEVTSRTYRQIPDGGLVRELNDLSNTFNTMASVLQEIITKTQRSLVEAEQFRSSDALAVTYAEESMPPVVLQRNGYELASVLDARQPNGQFCTLFENEDGVLGVLGEIRRRGEGLGEELELMARAVDTVSYFRHHLGADNAEEALRQAERFFQLGRATAFVWDGDSTALDVTTFDGGAVDARTVLLPARDDFVIFHTVDDETGKILNGYGQLMSHLGPGQLQRSIDRFFPEISGARVTIGRIRAEVATLDVEMETV